MEMLHVSTFETLYSGFKSYARRILGGFLEDSWRILGGFLEDSCRCLGLSGRFPLAVPERFSGDLTPLLPQSGRNADCFATNSTFDVAKG